MFLMLSARIWGLIALLVSVCASSVLIVRAKAAPGYKVVADWPTMPEGYILGTPQGAPTKAELQIAHDAGEFPWAITAFAGVAVDSKDRVYAFHRGQEDLKGRYPADTRSRKHPIAVFEADGGFLRWAGDRIEGGILGPHCMKVDADDRLWVVSRDGHRVIKLTEDLEDVALQLGVTGESGADETHFDQPTDVAWAANGDIFVSDGYGNHRVVKFAADGTFLRQWGGGPDASGSQDGVFNFPHGIAIDYRDRVYVVDRDNKLVQIFDTEGTFLGKWTDVGYNWGIAFGPDQGRGGFAYLAQKGTETLTKVDIDSGRVVDQWGGIGRSPGKLDGVHDVALDSQGDVYAADAWGQRVQKFVPQSWLQKAL